VVAFLRHPQGTRNFSYGIMASWHAEQVLQSATAMTAVSTACLSTRLVCRIAAQGDFAPRETNPRAYRFVAATKARESLFRVVEEERG